MGLRGAQRQKSLAELWSVLEIIEKYGHRKERHSALDPGCLAFGRLACASAALVGSVLAILRSHGEVVDHVPRVPDLVGFTITSPDLNLRGSRNKSMNS
jgi:hypothetical protein